MVYVLNLEGKPLMPTRRHGHVRRMLKAGRAKVVKRTPFTIQLLYKCTSYTQPVSLGVDAGSRHIGLSAVANGQVVYEADVELRDDITGLLSTRRELRRSRRSRKTRYRKPRFLNRTGSKKKGWLAPSAEAKINAHIKAVKDACRILPVTKITAETASFDIQKIKALMEGKPLPEGKDYQQGDQLGFWNVREYVFFRDGHKCRCCKGRSGDPVLEVHHMESRKTGGDSPGNLATLCRTCHEGYHKGKVKLPEDIQRMPSFRDAAFMGIMRWTVYDRLKEMYPGMVHMTYGYITKHVRINHKLPKGHCVDARCISGFPDALPPEETFYIKKIRCHNRQIFKQRTCKGGVRKRNQAPYLVKGFRLFDKVRYKGQECFIFGRRASGYFDIRLLDGTKVHAGVSYKKLKFLETRHNFITERRRQAAAV